MYVSELLTAVPSLVDQPATDMAASQVGIFRKKDTRKHLAVHAHRQGAHTSLQVERRVCFIEFGSTVFRLLYSVQWVTYIPAVAVHLTL